MTDTPPKKHNTYRDLNVWQEGVTLNKLIDAQLTQLSKKDSGSLIVTAIKQSAVSFPCKIAKAYSKRFYRAHFDPYFQSAHDTLIDLHTLFKTAVTLELIEQNDDLEEKVIALMKMTTSLAKKIRMSQKKSKKSSTVTDN